MTKAQIVTVLNSRLNRSETATTLAEAIKAGLKFVSDFARWPCLWHSAEYTTSEGDDNIAWPADFNELDRIVVNDGDNDSDPLTEITFREWLRNREDESSSNYDEPRHYAERGQYFYLDPPPDDNNYTITVYFWRYHPDQDTILFPESFREAVFNAVMGKYIEAKGASETFMKAANYYLSISVREMNKLPRDERESRVKYHDI